MLKRKLGFLLMMLLVLSALVQPTAARSCSGNDCGCDVAAAECREQCPPNDWRCNVACAREEKDCGIACCL